MANSETVMEVEYECGHSYVVPLVLRESQTLIANAALGDQMSLMVDQLHENEHPECS